MCACSCQNVFVCDIFFIFILFTYAFPFIAGQLLRNQQYQFLFDSTEWKHKMNEHKLRDKMPDNGWRCSHTMASIVIQRWHKKKKLGKQWDIQVNLQTKKIMAQLLFLCYMLYEFDLTFESSFFFFSCFLCFNNLIKDEIKLEIERVETTGQVRSQMIRVIVLFNQR